jgi:hypothetical protein
VSLEYKLQAVDSSTQVLTNTAKAKANRDGEAVVTALVEKTAGEVVAGAKKQ